MLLPPYHILFYNFSHLFFESCFDNKHYSLSSIILIFQISALHVCYKQNSATFAFSHTLWFRKIKKNWRMFIATPPPRSRFLFGNKNNKQAQEQHKQKGSNKKINKISIYDSIFVVYFHTLPSPGRLNMMHAYREREIERQRESERVGAAPIACDSVSWPIGQSFCDFIFGRPSPPHSTLSGEAASLRGSQGSSIYRFVVLTYIFPAVLGSRFFWFGNLSCDCNAQTQETCAWAEWGETTVILQL